MLRPPLTANGDVSTGSTSFSEIGPPANTLRLKRMKNIKGGASKAVDIIDCISSIEDRVPRLR